MTNGNVFLTKRLTVLEKKVDKLIDLVDDLTLTPQQYLKLAKANKAVEKGLHANWKTIDEAMQG